MLTFTTPKGSPVFVGQNAKENDELTMNFGKANDLWFHAEGVPGSHVILKANITDTECIIFARALALQYSKAGNSKKITMAYCGDIEKKKHSKAGEVVVKQVLRF